MTIQRIEGFDTLPAISDYRSNVTEGKVGLSTYTFVTGKDGLGRAVNLKGDATAANLLAFTPLQAATAYTSCTIGFWAKLGISYNSPANDWYSFAAFHQNTVTRLITCQFDRTNNRFRFLDSPSATAYVTGSTLPDTILNTWHFFEVHWTRGTGSAGWLKLWMDGVEILSFNGTTNSTAAGIVVGPTAGNYNITDYVEQEFDSLYISDQMASIYPCEIIVIPPTSDSAVAWTTSSGSSHFDLVDEIPISTADYVQVAQGAGNNLVDRFGITPAGYDNGGEILAFCVSATGIRTTTGTSWASLYRVAGANHLGTAVAPGDANARTARVIAELNPDTSLPWEWSDLASTEIGIDCLATGQGRRVYGVHGVVLASIAEQTETESETPTFVTETESETPTFVTETETPTPPFETETATSPFETETATPEETETATPPDEETETPEPPRLRVVTIMVAS